MPGRAGRKSASNVEREARLLKVAKLDRMGLTQIQIAHRLKVSQSQISQDLKTLRKRYLAEKLDPGTHAYKMVQQLAEIRSEARKAWERSKEDAERTTTTVEMLICDACGGTGTVLRNNEEQTCPACHGEGTQEESKTAHTKSGRLPDPNYLRIVRDTFADERELLGIDAAPKKPEVNVQINNSNQQNLQLNFDTLCLPSPVVDPVEERIKALSASTQDPIVVDNKDTEGVDGDGEEEIEEDLEYPEGIEEIEEGENDSD